MVCSIDVVDFTGAVDVVSGVTDIVPVGGTSVNEVSDRIVLDDVCVSAVIA